MRNKPKCIPLSWLNVRTSHGRNSIQMGRSNEFSPHYFHRFKPAFSAENQIQKFSFHLALGYVRLQKAFCLTVRTIMTLPRLRRMATILFMHCAYEVVLLGVYKTINELRRLHYV
jgi:hypothetical protein